MDVCIDDLGVYEGDDVRGGEGGRGGREEWREGERVGGGVTTCTNVCLH